MEILKTPFLFLLFVVVANGDVIGAQVFHYSYLHVHLFTLVPRVTNINFLLTLPVHNQVIRL